MLAALYAGIGVEDDDAAYYTQLGEVPRTDTMGSSTGSQPDACAEALGIPKVRHALPPACMV